MGIRGAIVEGFARVRAQPRLAAFAYVANVLLVLPLTAAMYAVLRASMGRGMVAERMRTGWDDLWYRGFQVDADAFSRTFHPSVSGIGAQLHALDDLVDASLLGLPGSAVAAGLAYIVVWVFVSGGLIARYAAREHEPSFWVEAARAFPRLLAIAALGWVAFAAVFRFGLPLTTAISDAALYDAVDERVHFAWAVFRYGAVWLVVGALSIVVDYAKIAAVLERRPGVLAPILVGAAVLRNHWKTAFGVALAAVGLQLLLLGAYAVFAPGIGHPNGFQILIAWAVAQTYVIGRIGLRCWGLAAHTAVAQRALART